MTNNTGQDTTVITYITIEQIIAADGQAIYRWDGKHHPALKDVIDNEDDIIGIVENGKLVMLDWTGRETRDNNLVEMAQLIGLEEVT